MMLFYELEDRTPMLVWTLRLHEPRKEVGGVWRPLERYGFDWENGVSVGETRPIEPWTLLVHRGDKLLCIEASKAEALIVLADTTWKNEGVDLVKVVPPTVDPETFDIRELDNLYMPVRRLGETLNGEYLEPRPDGTYLKGDGKWRFFPYEKYFLKEEEVAYTCVIHPSGDIVGWASHGDSRIFHRERNEKFLSKDEINLLKKQRSL